MIITKDHAKDKTFDTIDRELQDIYQKIRKATAKGEWDITEHIPNHKFAHNAQLRLRSLGYWVTYVDKTLWVQWM